VRRRIGLLLLAAAIGCSGLTESEGGIVGLEVSVPGPDTVEVGESIQLSARPLDKNGDSAATPVTWVSADSAATIDPSTGVLTGVTPGSARVQASAGALGSALITFAVVPAPDLLVLPADSIFTVARDAATLPDLVTRLDSFNPAGPLPGRGVIYAITSPDPAAAPPAVLLNGNVVSDTIITGTDGTAIGRLVVVPGATVPDSVIVEVRAEHTRGAPVPGSGQRFIVRFQP
jgi:Bacterial Ig-like domain (group 2)